MNCPNDNVPLHQVQITANYGQPLFLDQCDCCGGIWFDESELYRARQGEADKVDLLDTYILTKSTPIVNPVHCCPKDGTTWSASLTPISRQVFSWNAVRPVTASGWIEVSSANFSMRVRNCCARRNLRPKTRSCRNRCNWYWPNIRRTGIIVLSAGCRAF